MRSSAQARTLAAAAPHLPSRAEIDAVIAMEDPILRNLWITYTYHRLDLALGELLGGGDLSWCANDWPRLDERMNYIVDVFRSRQRDARLRRAPFSARQVAAIRDLHCPYGPL